MNGMWTTTKENEIQGEQVKKKIKRREEEILNESLRLHHFLVGISPSHLAPTPTKLRR